MADLDPKVYQIQYWVVYRIYFWSKNFFKNRKVQPKVYQMALRKNISNLLVI